MQALAVPIILPKKPSWIVKIRHIADGHVLPSSLLAGRRTCFTGFTPASWLPSWQRCALTSRPYLASHWMYCPRSLSVSFSPQRYHPFLTQPSLVQRLPLSPSPSFSLPP